MSPLQLVFVYNHLDPNWIPSLLGVLFGVYWETLQPAAAAAAAAVVVVVVVVVVVTVIVY